MIKVAAELVRPFYSMFNSRMWHIKFWMLFFWSIMNYSPCVLAGESSEYTLKAAFLYNFAAYTIWPESHVDTFKLCIYGSDPFGPELDVLLEDKKINEFAISVHRTNDMDFLTQCQLVFISRSAMTSSANILEVLKDQPVLTVADHPHAIQLGVCLNMDIKEEKITFEANLEIAKKAGLNLSSQLLRFASKVYQ